MNFETDTPLLSYSTFARWGTTAALPSLLYGGETAPFTLSSLGTEQPVSWHGAMSPNTGREGGKNSPENDPCLLRALSQWRGKEAKGSHSQRQAEKQQICCPLGPGRLPEGHHLVPAILKPQVGGQDGNKSISNSDIHGNHIGALNLWTGPVPCQS